MIIKCGVMLMHWSNYQGKVVFSREDEKTSIDYSLGSSHSDLIRVVIENNKTGFIQRNHSLYPATRLICILMMLNPRINWESENFADVWHFANTKLNPHRTH